MTTSEHDAYEDAYEEAWKMWADANVTLPPVMTAMTVASDSERACKEAYGTWAAANEAAAAALVAYEEAWAAYEEGDHRMSTITNEQEAAITDYLATHYLPVGVGTRTSACSIASINLALTGELTDAIPPCMSPVVGKWIIETQDAIIADDRNSDAWKRLLPLAAGTGRDHESERLAIVIDAMWEMFVAFQPTADEAGYGEAWLRMTTERTVAAADAASANATAYANAADAYDASYAASISAAKAVVAANADAAYADAYDAAYAVAANSAAYAAAVAGANIGHAAYGQWAVATLRRLVAL